jgi:hypothetical protein
MIKVDLPSGAVLDITPLPYEQAWGISQIVAGVIEDIEINIADVDKGDWKATDVLNLKKPLCKIISNKEVIDAAKQCWERCTYNKLRIDGQTFEKIEARQDFIYAAFYAIKENISPFFASLALNLPKK